MDFDSKRAGTGTMEWAEVTENITLGCANGCLYCYAAHNADRFGTKPRSEWTKEEFTKRVNMTTYSPREGVIMFPASHDITPFNITEYTRVAKLILEQGNKLLIVSKPRIECMCTLANELGEWKDNILFRFTIGSIHSDECAFWEPGAPSPEERVVSLKYMYSEGFKTSVSIEPMLEGSIEALQVVEVVDPYVTDTIWIGKMNKVQLRVSIEHADRISEIAEMQSDVEIKALYSALKNHPKIRWKDSINAVINR